MTKHHQLQIFYSSPKLHGYNALLNQLGRLRTYHVHAQNAVGLFIGHKLHHAAGFAGSHGPPVGGKGNGTGLVGITGILRFFFGLADHATSGWV